ncbi:GntR family transcriptional regulator [Azospirillum thermophilum]|uniref:GntR family transcriptional regulator n=1 Tax=Azospirillum thermophilum TaxID=2202148 RepID=A0A2S2CYQ6_9PROT|nr:GntR family transcriptional regulator [Azospirillum thermophilum]AWK89608.1 GntR family transcriptional regulator [Azospirillum thermophilum]
MLTVNTGPQSDIAVLTATGAIYDKLKGEIVKLTRWPGETISRSEIAEEFGVSSMPIHDAVRRLGNDGLVETVPTKGTFVARIPLDTLRTALEARRILEDKVVRRAAECAAAGDVQRLRGALQGQREAILQRDDLAFHQANEEFHRTLAATASYPFFWEVCSRIKLPIDRALRLAPSGQEQLYRFHADHQAVCEQVSRNDPDAAAEALASHFQAVRMVVERAIRQYPECFTGSWGVTETPAPDPA